MNQEMVVLTRDESGNATWRSQLELRGVQVYELPCIQTVAAEPTAEIEQILQNIRDYHWVIFTSAAGVRYFLELAGQIGLPLRSLTGAWIAAVGPQTADAIRSLGLPVTFTPSRQNATTLARELKRVKSRRILLLRTSLAPGEPVDILRRRSAKVTDLPIYQTIPLSGPDLGFNQLVRDGDISRLVFASPSAVQGFKQRLADPVILELAQNLPAVAIGPSVTAALVETGFTRIYTAAKPTVSAVLELLS